MFKRLRKSLLTLGVLTTATLLILSARAELKNRSNDQGNQNQGNQGDQDDQGNKGDKGDKHHKVPGIPLATGQFITPLALEDSVQQFLNPNLAAYPNFVAGEAVRSQLSPDGTTLAIITAGQNSLYKPDGTTDGANSTQFIFLYNVVGANRAKPLLTQVIKQVNGHVGLVF